MRPYHSDDWLTVYQGDCRDVMASMEPESVHCVVTSPPYWGLRDYGTATWIGGDAVCDHQPEPKRTRKFTNGRGEGVDDTYAGSNLTSWTYRDATVKAGACPKGCGAIREDGQLGLEPTPEAYVENMVAVFREVRRVLRDDGTVWLNLGDSYTPQSTHPAGAGRRGPNAVARGMAEAIINRPPFGKPKDLVGIPWMVAFALRADGWYLRSDIIWSKPNPMPESVTDRPTKSHEYLFLLSKSPRYYFDSEAVREPEIKGDAGSTFTEGKTGVNGLGRQQSEASRRSKMPDGWATHAGGHGSFHRDGREDGEPALIRGGRNSRSVWTVATQPYPGAHFATFPEKLVEPCVKAGTSERGVCPECGGPWTREWMRTQGDKEAAARPKHLQSAKSTLSLSGDGSVEWARRGSKRNTTGWRPTCDHVDETRDADGSWMAPLVLPPVPAVVLDPFAGSGTTGRVAQRLGRRAVLIDLNGDYLVQAMKRNQDIPLGLEVG